MLKQRLAAELSQHVDGVDPGVNKIAEDEIDDPVFAPERNCGLGAFLGEGEQPGSLAAGEHDAQHTDVRSSFHGEDGFLVGTFHHS